MTAARSLPDPGLVRRQNELFDLYNTWRGDGDPDDDPEFVAAAWRLMGLPPFRTNGDASRSVDLNEDDLLRSDLDDEELDDEEPDDGEELDEDELEDEGDMDVPRSVLDPDARERMFALARVGETRMFNGFINELRAGDDNQLKHYWTRGEGLAKWRTHPHPWTALRNHLRKYVGPGRAERMASDWFHEVFGYWPGHRKGTNPVGPG